MGKRQLGELEPSELVVAVLISDIASQPMQDVGTPLLYGLIPTLLLLACEVLIAGAAMKSPRFSGLVFGKPSIIVENGVINQREMRKNRITPDELGITLRKKDVTDISRVKYAILERDGSLSILLYQSESPVTPATLGIATSEPGYPIIVINDGRTMSDNLKKLGFDEKWLKKQLKSRGVSDAGSVYYMSVDESGGIYYAAKDSC